MKRVLIIGSGGSGKTTFARRLAAITDLPVVHLDRLYWRAGWHATPPDEWRATVQQVIAGDRWILDGNYSGTLDIRIEASDTIVFLDIARLVCIWRVLRRRLSNPGRARAELPVGCEERLTWEFLMWIWTYPARRRDAILQRLASHEGKKRVVILQSTKAIDEFFAGLRAS